MKNDEKLLKDRVNKNDNSKEKIEKKIKTVRRK
mgnify:CR=1 FL=1